MNLSNLGVAKKPKIGTKKNALSFISGGKPLGETIKESATNNIVGFHFFIEIIFKNSSLVRESFRKIPFMDEVVA